MVKTWTLVLFLSLSVCARAGTIIDLGGGWYTGTDNEGRGFTSVPLGDGWRTTIDNEGRANTTVPIGKGIWANVGPGNAPVVVPVPAERDRDE
jgi:hypothetical protein